MPARRILPDSGTIRQLHRKLTYAEIAEMYGVSETAVYLRVREDSPQDITPNARYRELLPWRVRLEHTWAQPAKFLRYLARRHGGGKALTEAQARYLENWLAKMRANNWVVAYEPDYPPNDASPTHGGFYYVTREPEDGDGYIRRPTASNPASIQDVL